MPKTPTKKKPQKTATPAKQGTTKKVSSTAATALVDLTPEERRGLAKPRAGFDEQAPSLFALYRTYSATLGALAASVDGAEANITRYDDLADDEAAAAKAVAAANKQLEMVQETRALEASQAWNVMLEIYGKAKEAGKKNPAIAAAIKPFVAFMALGPRKKPGPTDK